MKRPPRPLIQGKPATFREKLGSLVAGKPLYSEGSTAYHREDFVDTKPGDSPFGAPKAFARRMSRIIRTDHEKLDKLTNLDELWNEMDGDAIVGSARNRYEEALSAAELRIEVDEDLLPFCESVLRPGAPLLEDARARMVDSETRGFCLGEFTVATIERGGFAGLDTIGQIRRLERDAYRLQEDEYSRPELLEMWVADTTGFQSHQITSQTRYIGGTYKPQTLVIISPDDPDWTRYLFLTYPERGGRVAGLPRYGTAYPWYFFLIHLRQWMMTLAERTGTPIIVAEFAQTGDRLGDKYEITAEDMFAILEKIQTNFRGLIPSGFSVKALETGATDLMTGLVMLSDHCGAMIETAILGERVSSGAQAQGGTLGANQAILNTTFGGHVASGHRRLAGILSRMLEFLIEVNFGRKADVEITFDAVDPAKEALKVTNAEKAIAIGLASRHEPHLRSLFGLPALDDALLAATQAAKADAVRYGLDAEDVAPTATTPGSADTDKVLEIIDRVQDGDISDHLAAVMLATALGVTVEDAARVVAEEKARNAPAGTPVVAPVAAVAGQPDAVPTSTDEPTVQDTALNGAQVTALQGMLAAVQVGELAAEAAILAIITALPAIPEARARAMVAAQIAIKEPAAPAVAPELLTAASDEAAQIASWRMAGAMNALRRHIRADYDTSKPPPISGSLSMVMRAFTPDRVESDRRAGILRAQIGDALAAAFADVTTDEDALARFAEIEARFCDVETLLEFADV